MAISSYSINLNGTLAELGEKQVFTFQGTVGDHLFFDSIDTDPAYEAISYRLVDPTGFTVFSYDHLADHVPVTLTLTGTYQIVFDTPISVPTTGDYNLNLIKLNQAPALALGTTITDTLTPGLESSVYRITGTKGQRLQFDSLLAGTGAIWQLYGPNNQLVNSYWQVGTDFTATLPTTGEYYLILQGSNTSGSVNYSFQVNDISDPAPASPTAFPFAKSGTVSGTPVDYTFTAAAGKLVFFDGLTSNFNGVVVQILDPSGNILSSTYNTYDAPPYILPRSGTYTARISGTGDYSFRLLDLQGSATALTFGTPVTETLSPSTGTRVFSFAGTVGQRIYYDSLNTNSNIRTGIYSPSGNTVYTNFYSSTDSGIFTLTETGTYYLTQEGQNAAAGDFSFQLLQAPPSTVAFDTIINSSLSPFQTKLYQFNGTAGQRLVFDSQSSSASGAIWQLFGPNNEAIPNGYNSLSADLQVSLPSAGAYVLVVTSSSTSSIPYSFQVVTPTISTTALTLGNAVAGTISELGEQDIYTFSGATGQRLFYDATVLNGTNLTTSLISPSGIPVLNYYADYDGGLITLTETGNYQLVIQGNINVTPNTGNYNFKLIDASNAPTLTLDSVVTNTLSPGQESDFYRFTAAAGQRLVFDAISGSTSANIRIFDQGNTAITNASSAYDFDFTAPEAGTYLLQVEGNSATNINYSFQVVTPTTTSTPLTLGSPVSATISELGERDIYTFTGTAGQRLTYDSLANTYGNNINVSLVSPSGTQVGGTIQTNYDGGLVTLTETGTYQLIVEGQVNASGTGQYDFKLTDAGTAPTINLDSVVTNTLSPGLENDFYRFTAAAGQRLVFDAIAGANANFRVYDSGNTQIATANIAFDADFTVQEAGTYLLQIEGYSATNVNYSFQLVTPNTTSTPLTLGSPVSGTISELGEQDIYTFTGSAGQRLLFDSTSNNGNSLLVSLFSPSGAQVGGTIQTTYDGGLVTLTESGTYKLIIQSQVGAANSTGTYDFKLIDATAAPAITLGSTVNGTLSPGAESDFYRLTGTAGKKLNFDSLLSAAGANWRLYDPRNGQIAGSSANTDFVAFLDTSGTYLLQIEGYSATNVSYSFNVTDISDPTPASPTAFPFSRSGTVAGTPVDFSFTAAAGKLIFFDTLKVDSYGVYVDIFDSTGSIYGNYGYVDSTNGIVLPRSGTYTVRVTGTGDYNFRLLDLPASSTALTLGAATSAPLAAATTQFYRFTGSAGQRLLYDALAPDSDSINVSLLRPNGAVVSLNQNAESDAAPLTLTDDGTYYVVFRNNLATAANYNFRLSDFSAATPLSFNTVTNGTLSPGQETDLYRFTGSAGQRLVFDGPSGNYSALWYLYNPTNQVVAGSGNYLTTDYELNLTADGTYVLAIVGYAGATDVNYSFNLINPPTTTTVLPLNTPISGTIAVLGEQDIYTFTGTVGQRFYYDSLKSDTSDTLRVSLIDPTGDTVFLNQEADGDLAPFTLTEAGTYQLVLGGGQSYYLDTGTYNFQLLDLAAATPLNLDTVKTGTLSPGPETDLYSFSGTAGQRLVYDGPSGNTSALWYLYSPTNQQIAGSGNYISTDYELNLPADGTYVLAIVGYGGTAADVNYSFSLITPTTTTTALTLNSPVLGTIAEKGERDIYTFTGSVGQRLYYDNLKSDLSDTIRVSLIDPTGDLAFINQEADGDRAPFILTETGTYQLVLDSPRDYTFDTGTYNFQLLDLAAAAPLSLDTVTNGTLSPSQETNLYSFTGSAGQRVVFDSQLVGFNSSAIWTLYGPANQIVSGSGQYISSDYELNLTADGTYVLAITGNSATNVDYSFSLVTPTTSTTGSPNVDVTDRTGATNTPIPLNISASFANSDGNDLRSILISGVPTGATLSAGTNNNNGTWSLTPAQLSGLSITVTNPANFALTVSAKSAESTGDTAITLATFSVIVNIATGITVTPTSGLATTESGGSQTFAVVLDSQPTSNVTVGISSSDTTEGTTNVSSLTFTPANWNVAQNVIVTGVDDNIIDGPIPYTIVTAPATSSDPNYNNLNAADVSVTNADNDTAGVTVTPTSGLVTTEAGATAAFFVRLTSQPTANVTISISSSDTTEGTVSASSLTFTAANWNVNQTVTVTGVDDTVVDGNIPFTIVTGATSSTDSNYNGLVVADVSATNFDNDAASFSINDVSIVEGNAGTSLAVFTVTLNNAVAAGTSVAFATANGTATAGSDYLATSGTLNFTGNAGETKTVSVTINGDTSFEPDETFFLNLSAPTNGVTLADSQGLGTITNDDAAPLPVISLALNQPSVTENGATNLIYTFTRTGATTNPLTVNYSVNGTATNGNDYGLIPAAVTFAAGSATATLTVDPTADSVLEPDETVSLTLTADPAYIVGTTGAVTGTISNDDAASFSINDVSIVEGNAGTSLAVFTVTLNNAVAAGTSVAFATANGTATAGSDYLATSGTLNFTGNAGETKTVSVTINGDTSFEPDETFFLNLSAPTNGVTLADSQGLGTITNDDAAPLPVISLALNQPSVTENGATNLIYTFTRTGATTNPLTVNYSVNGTATNGNDYGLIPAAVTFAAGSATATLTVDPTADSVLEPDETVSLTLTADPAYIVGTTGAVTGTISNDDAASFSINDVSIVEGNAGTSLAVFTVTLNNAVAAGTSVAFATANGTATAGSDYLATSGTLNFTGNAGETKTVSVTINGDTSFEPDETFFLNLSAPTNGVTLADSQGLGTITNDDAAPLPVISLALNQPSVTENGATNLIYTFTRTGATTNPLTVNYSVNGTATNGNDYGLIPAAVTFAAGSATATLTVDPTADSVLEPDETVSLTLTADPAYIVGTTGAVTGTISNDDAASFSINDVSIVEGNAGTSLAVFTVTLNNAVAAGTSVAFATANGTATAGSDYLATSGTLNFTGNAGETKTVSVTINGDTSFEPDETFFLNLSAPTNGVTLADSQGLGTITNDDAAPLPVISLALNQPSVTENGATNLIYTFTRTGATTNPLTVNYSVNGTATNGNDYGLIPAAVTFAAGSATATLTVDPTADSVLEPDETVSLTLTADPAYIVGTTGAVTGTISNDDAASFSINDVSIVEGNAGTSLAVFTVTLNNAVAAGTSVAFATANGTATAGSDYLATSGTLNFTGNAGETKTVSVTINGDTSFEPDETFFLNLSAPTNGVTLADSQGLGTITNDDAAPLPVISLALNQPSVTENGATNLIYTFTRTGATTNPLTVNYSVNGTATNGNDYGLIPAAVTFAAGSATATLTVDPTADSVLEPDETVSLTLTADPAYIVGTTGAVTGTISNDDAASFSINDVSIVEGNAGTSLAVFTVTLNNAVAAGTSVAFATANGTATAGSDYLATSGTLNFTGNAGETKTVSVTINGDTSFEPDETFFLNLSAPTNGVTLADSQGLGTITNDDAAPLPVISLALNQPSVTENGATNLIYTFTRTGATTNPLTVNYSVNGTATNGNDYGLIPAAVTFAAGSATATLTVDPTADSVLEPDETVSLTLTADPAYIVGTTGAVTGTISNDDAASFSINDVSIVEGNAGTSLAVFTVTLNNAVAAGTSVAFATANGTATAGSDYLATSGTLNFTGNAGETKTVSVTINGDTSFEPDETFFLNLSAPTNGVTLADSQGLGTITNDDAAPLPVISLALNQPSVTENGATNLIYTFTRTGATTNPLTVNYSVNGTATNGNDYGLIPAAVTFAAGSATATLTVDPTADSVLEPDETVSLTLTADPAYIVGTTGAVTGTISNDDAASFSINDVSIVEGNAGTSLAVFTVTLNNAVAAGTSVAFATANGTATAGSDYLATSGTLNFTGNAGETKTVSVTINGDTSFEPDETFFLNLSAPTNGVTLADSQGLGTITNDDAAPLPVISLALNQPSVTENGATNLIYTFTRTGATTNPLTVNYSVNGTATNGNDYGLIPAAVTFAAGSATATLTVDPTADSVLEPDETVSLTLTADPAYIVGTTGAVTGTISNDDAASFSINDVSIVEGNAGTSLAVFTVTLNNAVAAGTSVAFATANGTATAGSDYLATSGTLNFTGNAGETKTVSVTINGDTSFEPDETFFLNLSAPTNGVTLADSQGLGTITNDDLGRVINGTKNKDSLVGTDGDDVITGLQGADTIRGNGGADRFVYTSIVDAGDTIIDFNRAQGDKVDLRGALASVGYTGTTPITDGYLKFVARGSDTMLQIDPDGSGLAAARNFILFKSIDVTTLSNPANFIL